MKDRYFIFIKANYSKDEGFKILVGPIEKNTRLTIMNRTKLSTAGIAESP
jgi:hypothetical protein